MRINRTFLWIEFFVVVEGCVVGVETAISSKRENRFNCETVVFVVEIDSNLNKLGIDELIKAFYAALPRISASKNDENDRSLTTVESLCQKFELLDVNDALGGCFVEIKRFFVCYLQKSQ